MSEPSEAQVLRSFLLLPSQAALNTQVSFPFAGLKFQEFSYVSTSRPLNGLDLRFVGTEQQTRAERQH
jgi:hypothetical protein